MISSIPINYAGWYSANHLPSFQVLPAKLTRQPLYLVSEPFIPRLVAGSERILTAPDKPSEVVSDPRFRRFVGRVSSGS